MKVKKRIYLVNDSGVIYPCSKKKARKVFMKIVNGETGVSLLRIENNEVLEIYYSRSRISPGMSHYLPRWERREKWNQ